jgi:hypothetical protein
LLVAAAAAALVALAVFALVALAAIALVALAAAVAGSAQRLAADRRRTAAPPSEKPR